MECILVAYQALEEIEARDERTDQREQDEGENSAEGTQHLTRHKISCREPSVHEPQHTLPTANTSSVNRWLARGQLHRLVRWLRRRGARVERQLCARETSFHQR